MKTPDEMGEILCEKSQALLDGSASIKHVREINALSGKISRIQNLIYKSKLSKGAYTQDELDRIHAMGDRLSAVLDVFIRGDLSPDEKNEIKAAKAECIVLVRELSGYR